MDSKISSVSLAGVVLVSSPRGILSKTSAGGWYGRSSGGLVGELSRTSTAAAVATAVTSEYALEPAGVAAKVEGLANSKSTSVAIFVIVSVGSPSSPSSSFFSFMLLSPSFHVSFVLRICLFLLAMCSMLSARVVNLVMTEDIWREMDPRRKARWESKAERGADGLALSFLEGGWEWEDWDMLRLKG